MKDQSFMDTKVAILGGGGMATACATLLSESSDIAVSMWVRKPEVAADMQKSRENKRLLPGVTLAESIQVTSDVDEAVSDADYLVVAIPTEFLRQALTKLAPHLKNVTPVISVIKGIEQDTFFRPSEIIADVLGPRPVVALGGPSHAEEIARRLPASVVAASGDIQLAKETQKLFSTDRFRVYTNVDIVGVELAGALKNVIAIAAGICDGGKYGDNAKSAIMTRGLVEMNRFGSAYGAEPSTFSGLAGVGDLITTCMSPFGRNRSLGERLGLGETREEIISSMDAVAEGVNTTRSVYDLAEAKGLDMPITTEIFRVLFEGKSPEAATQTLMTRPQREE
ncbi:Glycerol-3-phosphate dehydrogenase [NAD(P)+] [Gimesia maris]|nr:Glycerol-3-phosphate dehydrogenase [NAD(P)+] [Gimesia maris]|tara:strand:+ start:79900 stop:80913 length:1014 start_codon:yes stop_codon:yes gene_type:complete